MSNISKDQNNSLDLISLRKNNEATHKAYHPLEFYTLGKSDPNLNKSNFFSSNNLSKTNSRLNYNNSSHELFNRNLLSVNNSYIDKYKEIKPKPPIDIYLKKGNNYLEPLNSMTIRNNQIIESQKLNNINSLEWFHIIKKKVYIVDQNSKIKKGNNITRNKFYEEKGMSQAEKNDNNNNTKGNDVYIGSCNNILGIKRIFNPRRFKKGNEYLSSQKDLFKTEREIKQIESDNNYWKKLRIQHSSEGNSTISSDIKKYDEKKLKAKFMYFDKNQKGIIRHKNWWKIDP